MLHWCKCFFLSWKCRNFRFIYLRQASLRIGVKPNVSFVDLVGGWCSHNLFGHVLQDDRINGWLLLMAAPHCSVNEFGNVGLFLSRDSPRNLAPCCYKIIKKNWQMKKLKNENKIKRKLNVFNCKNDDLQTSKISAMSTEKWFVMTRVVCARTSSVPATYNAHACDPTWFMWRDFLAVVCVFIMKILATINAAKYFRIENQAWIRSLTLSNGEQNGKKRKTRIQIHGSDERVSAAIDLANQRPKINISMSNKSINYSSNYNECDCHAIYRDFAFSRSFFFIQK